MKIICEIGANHCQDYERALCLVYEAAEAGADAVKVQMYTPDGMTLDSKDERFYIKDGLWKGQSLYQLYEKTCMPYEWVPKLKNVAETQGMFFVASVYDLETVRIAEDMGIDWYKIASYEASWHELVQAVGDTKKPTMISLGCCMDYPEAYQAWRPIKKKNRYLMHCVSQYPADIKDMNLRTITDLTRYGWAGLSDHTPDLTAAVVATALGASVIEKHMDLDGAGPDGKFSLTPDVFKMLVDTVRDAEKSIGGVMYRGTERFKRELINGKMVRTI